MKVLWVSDSPTTASGYGGQTAIAVRVLRDLGHHVTILARDLGGAAGMIREWEGFPVLPCGNLLYGNGIIAPHARAIGADLVFMLCDPWVTDASQFAGLNVAAWIPVDTSPLAAEDGAWLDEARKHCASLTPVAMSRHGASMLTAAGHDALYLPHSADTSVFRPAADRDALRRGLNLPPGAFVALIVADNRGSRKALPAQMEGFARFRRHASAKLAALRMHTDPRRAAEDSWDLLAVADDLGIADFTAYPDPYLMETGRYTPADLAEMYQTADVLLAATMGEGFGVPIIEAMACGTPVIATRASAMTELVPPQAGWLVNGDRWWHPAHRAWWVHPSAGEIERQLERALTGAARLRKSALAWSRHYAADTVAREHWPAVMSAIQARCKPPVTQRESAKNLAREAATDLGAPDLAGLPGG